MARLVGLLIEGDRLPLAEPRLLAVADPVGRFRMVPAVPRLRRWALGRLPGVPGV